jgi:Polysaccharide biosynthesis protein
VKLDDVNTKIEQQKLGSLKSLLGNKLFGSGMISLLIKVSGAGLSYLMFVAFAHLLNAEDYGVFAFTFNLAVVVSAFAGFGYSTAIMRYLPKYLAQGRPEYANGAIKMGTQPRHRISAFDWICGGSFVDGCVKSQLFCCGSFGVYVLHR